jgi:AcrR family transcriptional regulator
MPKLIDIDALFDTTVRAFAELGYGAATTQEIASRAGVHEVTLFRRYGTKAALIEAALSHCLAAAPFGRVVATDDVRADLAAIVEAYALTNRAYGGAVVMLLMEVPRHPELSGALSALKANLDNAGRIVAGHQERGRILPGDPVQKVGYLIAPVLAAGLWARSGTALAAWEFDPWAVADAFLYGQRPAPAGDGAPTVNATG